MSVVNSTSPPRARQALFAIGLVALVGIAVGWFLDPSRSRTFDYAYALMKPTFVATMCILAVHGSAKQWRWLVPLLLTAATLSVASRPHVVAITAIGGAGGLLVLVASLVGHKRFAIAGTLICCSSIAATLLAGLLGEAPPLSTHYPISALGATGALAPARPGGRAARAGRGRLQPCRH